MLNKEWRTTPMCVVKGEQTTKAISVNRNKTAYTFSINTFDEGVCVNREDTTPRISRASEQKRHKNVNRNETTNTTYKIYLTNTTHTNTY